MIPSLLLLVVQLHSIAPASPPKNTDVMAELRAMAGGEITIPNDIAKAIQVFQQVQEEFTTEKQQLSTSTNPQTMQFWSALQAIRRKENSGKFLRSMQTAGHSIQKYKDTNYGYGIVFYPGFQQLIRAIFAQRPSPLNILVFGSNVGTEVLYLYHLFRKDVKSIVGIEILATLNKFAQDNAISNGFDQTVLHFHCYDALQTDATLLQNSDLIWIDNQVWDLTLNIQIISMLQKASLKKNAIVVDFASAKNSHLHQTFLQESLSSSLFREMNFREWRVPTSWAGNDPGAEVRVYQVL
jgi:hypothetical protein